MSTYRDRLRRIDALQQDMQALRPLEEEELRQLKEYYRIGFTYTSNSLEGNSLTETETKVVIEDGITIGGKPLRDHLEAIGHSDAFDLMYQLAASRDITEQNILEFHRLFYRKIDEDNAGKYRRVRVFLTGSSFKFPPPSQVKSLMKTFLTTLPELRQQHHPVVYAALAHKDFVEIHPFVDGNGRTARLFMNLILLQHGYPITSIPPILRSEYINALEASHHGNDTPFLNLITKVMIEAQKDFLRLFQDDV